MAWDGSGNYTRTNGTNTGATTWQDDAAAATKIRADRHDTHDEDIATAINACITQNNESKPTADFLPNVNATYDIGSASLQWVDGHFSGNISVGGTVDGRDIAADGAILDAIGAQNVKLNTKVIDIGDWDMDATGSVSIAHGLTDANTRPVLVTIRDDSGTSHKDFAGDGGSINVTGGNVILGRTTGGTFDNINYNSTSFNRGWITILYTD